MTRRPHRMLISLALGLCILAWLAPAGDARRAPSARSSATAPLSGINISGGGLPAEIDRQIALAHTLHAKVVRTQVSWASLEPLASGQINQESLASLDRLMADASAASIRVIATVDGTPCWASSAPASLQRACVPGRSSKANAWPPSNPATYAAFVAFLAQRYGARLAAIEVWNEPDQANKTTSPAPKNPSATPRSCGPPIRRSSRRTQTCRCSPARSSAPTGSSCGRSMQPGSRATTTAWPCTTTP